MHTPNRPTMCYCGTVKQTPTLEALRRTLGHLHEEMNDPHNDWAGTRNRLSALVDAAAEALKAKHSRISPREATILAKAVAAIHADDLAEAGALILSAFEREEEDER